ncbi:MAG: ROK family protein, partial [Propionibacteriaceae bacterium]|nr:ROK family protein [Propionibacteriaceae bacterium]
MHSAVVGAERIDHGTMRTINLALLLGTLRSGPISRAELSRRTHLSKASITSLAAELAARGLVREGSPDRNGTVGRPGTMLTLEGARVCGVGLEINAEYLAVCVVDLCGTVLYDRAQPFDVASLPISDVLDEVAGIMRDTLEQLHSARRHVAQVMVSAPGVIKQPAGTVHLASNLGWRDVPLRSQLLQRLDADISLQVESDAKLAAVAEYRRYEDSDVRDLVYLSGDIGV